MADEITSNEATEITPEQADTWAQKLMETYIEKAGERDFRPYVERIGDSVRRSLNLIARTEQADTETAAEILRAVVVLNHAYLEDFLRNLALALLPLAGEEALNSVPLAGTTGRAEKFFLGKLARHRGKGIDDLIRESVSTHMERSTFNSVTEILLFLESIELKLPRTKENVASPLPQLGVERDTLALLEAMMKRRHHIVHRADRNNAGDGLLEITQNEVVLWLAATLLFTLSLAQQNFTQQHSYERFLKNVNRF